MVRQPDDPAFTSTQRRPHATIPRMTDPFSATAGWLHEHYLIPVLYRLDMMQWEDIAYGWLLFALYGVAQVGLMLAICWPMEKWRALEHWQDHKTVRVEIL